MIGEYISFNELLKNKEICIPIIQRDYIQGADAKNINDVRKRLIDDLIDTLKSDSSILDLGIIYGINKTKKFYPVDGQQRLTTLYLFQWFLAIKANKIDEFRDLNNKLMYMTRKSAREFFSFIVDTIIDKEHKYYAEIIDVINDNKKRNFIELVKSKIWFKSRWNNDITVNSVLNIINDFIELKINNNDAKRYYNNLDKIKFYFLTESSENAEKESAIRYIRMNSRGKQLTYFENIKAILEIIEDKIQSNKEDQFVYQYDSKFIDVFYKKLDDNLHFLEKTKSINEESINLLMSVYNVLAFLKKNANEKKQYEKYEDYYIYVHNVSQSSDNMSYEEKNFWLEYFNMLKAVLKYSYEKEDMLKYVGEIFHDIYTINEESALNVIDNNRIVAYLRYIYYLYVCPVKNQGNNIEKMQKLKYVLENLQYDKWKQNRYKEIDSFVREISMNHDVFIYLGEEYKTINKTFDSLCENAEVLKLDIHFKSIGVNDIKQRFKEVSIKAKIINDYGFDYAEFEKLEIKSKCEKIQYLFYICDLWGETITNEKVEKLKKYLYISSRYFMECTRNYYVRITNKEFEWRKIFAIAANWDKVNHELLSYDEVNENSNKNITDNHNVWYWKDEYYFWDDKEEIKKVKLNIVRQAYDLILENKLTLEEDLILEKDLKKFYKDILGKEEYNMCWLKYAVDRKYEKLLCSQIRYENNKLEILFRKLDKNYGIYRDIFSDFFAIVFYLDNEKNNNSDININMLDSNGYICLGNFTLYENVYKDFTLWKKQKYIHKLKGRYYQGDANHNMHLFAYYGIKTLTDGGNVFLCDNNKNNIYRYDFYNNKYTIFRWNIVGMKKEFSDFVIEAQKELKEIENEYNKNSYERILDVNWRYDDKWIHVEDERRKDWRYISSNSREEKNINWEQIGDGELLINGDMNG